MATGHIKIDRRILLWEWYDDINTFKLFMHFLIKANFVDENRRGMVLKRGQLIIGRSKLSKETGLTEQQIRTCLKKLVSTNEIEIQPTNKNTIVTICKYDSYQKSSKNSNQQSTSISTSTSTNKKQANTNSEPIDYENEKEKSTNKATSVLTTIKEVKNIKNINNNSVNNNLGVVHADECVTNDEQDLPNNEQQEMDEQTRQMNLQIQTQEKMIVPEMNDIWKKHKPKYPTMIEEDFHALLQIAYLIASAKGWKESDVIDFKKFNTLAIWDNTVKFIVENSSEYIKKLTLNGLAIKSNWQKVLSEFMIFEEKKKQKLKEAKNPKSGDNGITQPKIRV